MSHNAKVQSSLGDAYSYFSRNDGAIGAYKTSLAVEDNPAVREALAVQLLRQGNPELAESHLGHVLKQPDASKAGLILLLAEGYQAQAQHDRAIELMDRAADVSPQIRDDKAFQKDRTKAEKYRQSGKAIKPVTLATPKTAGYREGGSGGRLARFIAPALAFVGLCTYFVVAWRQGQHRELFVVNGLGVPYTAVVGVTPVDLPAGGHRRLEVAEGTLHVTADAQGTPVGEYDVNVRTPYWKRPFLSRTFVINPDRTALITRETVYYSVNPADAPEPEYETRVGEPLYEFSGIDFPFQPFPQQIDLPSERDVVSRTRVGNESLHDVNDGAMMFLLQDSLPPDDPNAVRDFVTTHLRFSPERETLLLWLKTLMPPEEYLDHLRERLDDRPVLVHWHRVYQETMESTHPEHDLVAEYRTLLAADPSSAELAYLLGRVTPDPQESEQLFRQAIAANPPSAFGYNALAYQLLSEGRFEEGLPLAEQAVQLQPETPSFGKVLEELRLATGHWDELLSEDRTNQSEGMFGADMRALNEIRILAMQGEGAAARKTIDDFQQQAQTPGESESARGLADYLKTMLAYFEGNATEFVTQMRALREGDEPDTYDPAFVDGQLEQAAQLAAENDDASTAAIQHLSIYLKAHAAGNEMLAQQELAQGIAKLREGGRDERTFADALAPEGTSQPDILLALATWPSRKRVLLAALGTRYPDDRDTYFTMARTLNFQREVPWLFLREYLGQN